LIELARVAPGLNWKVVLIHQMAENIIRFLKLQEIKMKIRYFKNKMVYQKINKSGNFDLFSSLEKFRFRFES